MINASEALRIILENTPRLAMENVPLLDALGRALGEDIISKENLPAFDNSAMDGFAVASTDLKEVSTDQPRVLKVVGESSAGKPFRGIVSSGQTVRVMTGGIIPKSADAVVPIEHATVLDEKGVRLTERVRVGQYVRARGEDIESGVKVLSAGQVVTPGSIGVLASLGYKKVRVYQRPCVNILATGDEIVDVENVPSEGQVRNSSSFMLTAYIIGAGGISRILGIVSDEREGLRKKLRDALDKDVLLITGGVSVGKYDYVKDALAELGVEVKFWKVNIKPGMPLVFGKLKKTLVFGLPGNPVSTGVTFLQFVKPALLRLGGHEEVMPMRFSAVLDQDITKTDGKRHYLRGIVARRDGILRAATTGIQSSGAMSSLSKANCLIIVPEGVTELCRGDSIEVELL